MNYQTSYIDIDSTFRNRTEWPNSNEFLVRVNLKDKTQLESTDPVSDQAPVSEWQLGRFAVNPPSATLTGTVAAVNSTSFGATADNKNVLVIITSVEPQTIYNYYRKAIVINTTNGESQRIARYTYKKKLGTRFRFELVLEHSFDEITSGDVISINEATNYVDGRWMFVPNSTDLNYTSLEDYELVSSTNRVRSLLDGWVQNDTQSDATGSPVTQQITYYDNKTGVLEHGGTGPLHFLKGERVSIRKTLVYRYGRSLNSLSGSGDLYKTMITFPDTVYVTTEGKNLWTNYFVRFPEYDITSNDPLLFPGQYASRTITNMVIRRITSSLFDSGVAGLTNGVSSIELTNGNIVDDYYKDYEIVVGGIAYLVTGYNGTTKIATISGTFGVVPVQYDPWYFRTVKWSTPVTNEIWTGWYFEIYKWSRDNEVQLTLRLPQQISGVNQNVYEIKLNHLILPNIEFYNYFLREHDAVYVTLFQQERDTNLIHSNNAFVNKALFRVPLDSCLQNINFASKFVTIDGNGVIQVLHINMNKPFVFKVFFSIIHHDVVVDIEGETYSPLPPNPYNQISALFEIHRLS